MRPDKLSYLVDAEGKLYVRARHMLRPAEKGGVFVNQVQVQGGAQADPEVNEASCRSERLKEKNLIQSKSSKCVPRMMTPPSSESIVDSIGFTGSKLQKKCKSRMSQIPFDRMRGASPSSTFSGRVLPLVHRPYSLLQSLPLPSLSVVGCPPRDSAAASIDTVSSCPPFPRPSSQGLRQTVPLSPAAPEFTPWSLPSGSGLLQAG